MEINHDLIYILAVVIIVLAAILETLNKKNKKPSNSAGNLDEQAGRPINNNQRNRINTSKRTNQSATYNNNNCNVIDVKEKKYSAINRENQIVDKNKDSKNEIIDVSDKKELKRMIIASEILKRKF